MIYSLRKVLQDLPSVANVVDVSARDGLQAASPVLSPSVRAAWVRRLLDAGVPEVEAGSFVHSGRVPQMAGSADVISSLLPFVDRLWVLVPNRRGLEEALAAGARNVVCLVSATETHSRANLGRSVREVVASLSPLAGVVRSARARARLAISMVWVDPDEGVVPNERVVEIARESADMGFTELTLCDTYGGASPLAVSELLEALSSIFPPERLGLHLHDTWGGASANVLAGLAAGVTRFDGSIGGLGGCPFAPGARGNMATEHLVHLLSGLGVETGIDQTALREASERCLSELSKAALGDAESAALGAPVCGRPGMEG